MIISRTAKTIIALSILLSVAAVLVARFSPARAGRPTSGIEAFLGRAPGAFDLSKATIPVQEIHSGGVPKDGIPAILDPSFVSAGEVDFLREEDIVLGFVHDGVARAYPLRILVRHEIVNDTVAGQPIAATYCPLCGTAMVFDRRVGGRELTFGVSGLLYNSDVLMYDHQTDSLWSQLKTESVAGKHAGTPLKWLSGPQMTWKAWKEQYPHSEVLSTNGGDYSRMPYGGYEESEGTMFPVPFSRHELGKKEWVYGIVVDGIAKAYPVAELAKLEGEVITETIGATKVSVYYDSETKSANFNRQDNGSPIPSVNAYWFAWQAFHPQTELHASD